MPVGRLATDRSEADPQLMTYRNFLDSFLYPYIDGVSEEVLAENLRRCAATLPAVCATPLPCANRECHDNATARAAL